MADRCRSEWHISRPKVCTELISALVRLPRRDINIGNRHASFNMMNAQAAICAQPRRPRYLPNSTRPAGCIRIIAYKDVSQHIRGEK
jgi:hypothetical protein